MARRITIETNTTGKQYVSIKRTRSHHHHHHHHHDYVKVGREDWKRMVERERTLESANKSLNCEIGKLKSSLSAAEAELHRLGRVVVPQLECQISTLTAENQELRRALDCNSGNWSKHHAAELEKLHRQIECLEKENKDLRCDKSHLGKRIEDLLRQLGDRCNRSVNHLIDDIAHWKDKFFDMQDRRNSLSDLLDTQEMKLRKYEDLLRRNGLIC
jgi:chromosome segregation ATPase